MFVITYAAINLTNKKFYVGSALDFPSRQKSHLNSKDDYPFQNSLRKNPDNFFWLVSEEDGLDTRNEEQFYLDFYHGTVWCYNLNPSASAPPSALGAGGPGHHLHGTKQTAEHIEKRIAHQIGEGNHAYGKHWWNNGEGDYVLSHECPGDGWTLGGRGPEPGSMSGEKNPMFGASGELSPCFGTHWYNNGVEVVKTHEKPGEEWVEGRGHWFSNGVNETFSLQPPDEDWVRGRLKRAK